jgi:hypothetical protein
LNLTKKEKIITPMENSARDAGGNRFAALEKKVNEVEALVGEFTQELLDLKAMTREMSQKNKEHRLQEPGYMQGTGTPVPDAAETALPLHEGSTIISDSWTCAEDPVSPAPDEPLMVMIMQTDGTMKPEPRRGNRDCTLAPVGYGASGGSGRYRKGMQTGPGQSRLFGTAEKKPSGRQDFA